ncbi:DNA-binding transcriptional MerR regulator [Neomicrococcus aestuarii]|uniref:DNA-binding transcriptional MerR regulator n=1 Tax=Neomicrococcus aestuarii TaxID=556325 RepID=A0A7W8TUL6_9MICC|nr:TipAS antibiotic-recognition domain-containing protein [Neomicrococcus aestuarii]MBB5513197.1 DNA-binding transcriptional MerR regulator [Neomicrococcus aestuarii]
MNTENREWSIQELARISGTTSRTLRHYHELGLVLPARLGANGMRYYDDAALAALLNVLALRSLGLSLERIKTIRAGEDDLVSALESRVRELGELQAQVQRQRRSVQLTIDQLTKGQTAMNADNFDGFDNSVYQEEVEARWGKDAYASSQRRWNALSKEQRNAHQQDHVDIALEYQRLAEAGIEPDAESAQAVAARHVAWLAVFTKPAQPYVVGLAEMYVADPRFAANYHGRAEYVRDALTVYADRELPR